MNQRWRTGYPVSFQVGAVAILMTIGLSLPVAYVLSNRHQRVEVQTVTEMQGTVQPVQLAFAETGENQNEAKAEAVEPQEQPMQQSEPVIEETQRQRSTEQNTVSRSGGVDRGGAEERVKAPAHGPLIGTFKITAYDLSVESCRKARSHKEYGITAGGFDLKGLDARARKIAVDPKVIPMRTTVYIEFPEETRYITLPDGTKFDLNGEWTAVDTGSAVKGNHIDLFLGEDAPGEKFYYKLCNEFGVKSAKVYSMK